MRTKDLVLFWEFLRAGLDRSVDYNRPMDMESIRDTIAVALSKRGLEVIPLGNTIHVIGQTDYEIVIRTLRPFEEKPFTSNMPSGDTDE